MNFSSKNNIVLYSILVLLASALICFISYQLDNVNISILTVLSPSIIAFLITLFTEGKSGLRKLFIKPTTRKIHWKWLLISFGTIPVLASLSMLINTGFNISQFSLRTTQLMPQLIIIIVIALGEEYGWRAYLLPRVMKRFGVLNAGVIVGLIWGIWHYPAYLIGTGTPLEMSFAFFMVWVVIGSVFMTWLYYKTSSVLTAILFHIGANASFNYLRILPEFTGRMTDFYVVTGLLFVIITVLFFNTKYSSLGKKKGQLEMQS